jgi:protein-S-isoprenylcysteine O-methyltransferase Ste14
MKRLLTISYGAANYLIFLAAFVYAIGFVGNIWVPRSIDAGVAAPIGEAVTVNVLLLGLFAVQHTVMARPAFKRWWTRFVNPSIEMHLRRRLGPQIRPNHGFIRPLFGR